MLFRPADEDVRLNPGLAQHTHAVLGGLCLYLLRSAQVGDEREVDVQDVFPPRPLAELPYGLKEGLVFYVAHNAADLRDNYVGVGAVQPLNTFDNLVGDMRDDLHRLSQVLPLRSFMITAL